MNRAIDYAEGWPTRPRLEIVRKHGTDIQYINALELELSIALAEIRRLNALIDRNQ